MVALACARGCCASFSPGRMRDALYDDAQVLQAAFGAVAAKRRLAWIAPARASACRLPGKGHARYTGA